MDFFFLFFPDSWLLSPPLPSQFIMLAYAFQPQKFPVSVYILIQLSRLSGQISLPSFLRISLPFSLFFNIYLTVLSPCCGTEDL